MGKRFRVRAAEGRGGGVERFRAVDADFPSVERPFVRRHPLTGKLALMGFKGAFASHIAGVSREQTWEIFRRAERLCEVPEYQLRVPWCAEGDVVIVDNYCVKHRVVADFYGIPPESRLFENIGTKGIPSSDNVVLPAGQDIDEDTRASFAGHLKGNHDTPVFRGKTNAAGDEISDLPPSSRL